MDMAKLDAAEVGLSGLLHRADALVGRRDASSKIRRDAFLYLPPKAPKEEHAQCGTCQTFVESKERCAILGATHVTAKKSCGLYEHGGPHDQVIRSIYTTEQVGLVDRQVRCENCISSDGEGHCGLYKKLNQALPDLFDLDESIEAQACCNAQMPKAG